MNSFLHVTFLMSSVFGYVKINMTYYSSCYFFYGPSCFLSHLPTRTEGWWIWGDCVLGGGEVCTVCIRLGNRNIAVSRLLAKFSISLKLCFLSVVTFYIWCYDETCFLCNIIYFALHWEVQARFTRWGGLQVTVSQLPLAGFLPLVLTVSDWLNHDDRHCVLGQLSYVCVTSACCFCCLW